MPMTEGLDHEVRMLAYAARRFALTEIMKELASRQLM